MASEKALELQHYLKKLDNDKCSNTVTAENSHKAFEKMHLNITTNDRRNSELAESPKIIYVNPNYGVRKHVIHVNPNVHAKVSIHVNPKLNSKTSTHVNPNVCTKASIYLNPKIVKNMDVLQHLQKEENRSITSTENSEPNTSTEKIQNSVYINPKLLKKISSAETKKNTASKKKIVTEDIICTAHSELNLKSVIKKKNTISNFIPLSCRKLVRLKRNSKGTTSTLIVSQNKLRKISGTGLKIGNIKSSTLLATANRSCQADNFSKFVKSKNSISQYKVDKTVIQEGKTKISGFVKKKTLSNSMKLVSIGGISYKSSKNQLVRRTSTTPIKRKRIISSKGHEQFYIASNGKALRRLDATIKCQTHMNSSNITINKNKVTLIRRKFIPPVKQNLKGNISSKVKQRSIQILRNKMRKNNQPCLFFQKFGYCANQAVGTCHKVHDKKQVTLCRNFLQGKCILDVCGLSHDVGPEKMPTCKYFLEGCCTRDACPYLHVKVSSNTPICRQFLQGYCEQGNKCKQRHIYACPEFEKTGNCSKGKYCPYPHKAKTPKISCTLQKRNNLAPLKAQESTVTDASRKRYYDNCSEDLGKKRESLLRKLKIIKAVQAGQAEESINKNEISDIEHRSEPDKGGGLVLERPKRPPIGPLPSYIPIN